MPCDSISTQTISAALKAAVPDVLLAALAAEGWTTAGVVDGTIVARRGEDLLTWSAGVGLTVTSRTEERGKGLIQGLTVAYSRAAVTWAAKRAGWQVQTTGDNKLTVTRR